MTYAAAGVEDLRLKYPGEESFIFKDLSLSVRSGEKLLLLGPSGCGKSTLLQVLSGMIPSLIEIPMRCSAQVVPDSWGILFQDPDSQFCMPYVDEELAFVLENWQVPREEMHARIQASLQRVGLMLEDIHVPISSLSQGMKQRLALASILLLDPEVLLLDEPSALLDPDGRRQIWQAVKQVSDGRTLIIVEHRIEELLEMELVDRVALFAPDGRLLGIGAPEEIFVCFKQELMDYGIWYPGVWEEFHGLRSKGALKHPAKSEERSIDNRQQQIQLKPEEPLLRLSGFQGIRQGRTVISVNHAEVYPGDFIAVSGPNGAGKSSLLLSLIGLLPTAGEYLLCGKAMHGTKKLKHRVASAAQQIGFVFQNPELQFVENRVDKEAGYSLKEQGMAPEEIRDRVADILNGFGLSGLEQRHPYQLSLGQKRRLSVAGAVIQNKQILLLDEPTFGQDAVNTFSILSICEELRRRGTAIIMVTHEEQISGQVATRRWEISGGVLLERGERVIG